MIANWPVTFFAIMPTNNKLMGIEPAMAGPESRGHDPDLGLTASGADGTRHGGLGRFPHSIPQLSQSAPSSLVGGKGPWCSAMAWVQGTRVGSSALHCPLVTRKPSKKAREGFPTGAAVCYESPRLGTAWPLTRAFSWSASRLTHFLLLLRHRREVHHIGSKDGGETTESLSGRPARLSPSIIRSV
jgi:hypothetical protein